MRVQLFTHGSDLDGRSCSIIAKAVFGAENVDVEYCEYNNINEKFDEWASAGKDQYYDKIFITDISVNEEIAKHIDEYPDIKDKIRLLDHHGTALHLNKYDWAEVFVDEENPKSGTLLFWQYLCESEDIDLLLTEWTWMDQFALNVSRYDVWLWYKEGDVYPKELNQLMYIYGKKEFEEIVLVKFIKQEPMIGDTERLLLDLKQKEVDNYIYKKSRTMIEKTIFLGDNPMGGDQYEVGIVFAELNISELGNTLASDNEHLDFIAIINPERSVSLRGIKDDINLGELAKNFGGGGHRLAAGFSIDDAFTANFIDKIFKQ